MSEAMLDNFPVVLTLRFRSEHEKSEFLGQLSDGWGENFVGLEWEGESLDTSDPVCVEVLDEIEDWN